MRKECEWGGVHSELEGEWEGELSSRKVSSGEGEWHEGKLGRRTHVRHYCLY